MDLARLHLAVVALLCVSSSSPTHAQCETVKLTGPPLDPFKSEFGFSASLSSERMAIGTPYDVPTGSADILERSLEGAWITVATVIPSDGELYDQFGYSVAIDGDTLVVGSTDHGALGAKGAAYVFERQPDGAWLETAKLVPPSDAWAFGWAVDVEGDRIVVGAKGASSLSGGKGMAFVYERVGGAWVKKATVKPSISVGGDGFGASLDLDGERLVVGAPYAWTGISPNEGLAFVLERNASGSSWIQKAVLSPADLQDNDLFGIGVALEGDRIVVGAPEHDLPLFSMGAAYVFDRIGGAWTQAAKLSPPGSLQGTEFGWAVDVEGDRAVIGAQIDSDLAPGAGAAYRFDKGRGGWTETGKFYGSGLAIGDTFGYALDLEGSELLVGAPNSLGSTVSPGYAYLFALDSAAASLIADADEVSLSAGGTQTLNLGACGAHAGDVYVLAGSASGTSPGFRFAGQPVPLNPDAYFLYTLSHAGAPPLVDGVGVLDAFGFAQAIFAVPPGTAPSLAGLVLHHAYAVLDAATLALEAVSPAVGVALAP